MPSTERFGPALDQVLELVVLLNEDMERSFAHDGLTTSRAHLLWELQHRGPSTQRVLAEALDVSPRNITGLVDALVATGFVTREPHPDDRRASLVSFTEHGAKIAAEMAAGYGELAEVLFGGMSPAQFDCFTERLSGLLVRLRTRLEAETPTHDARTSTVGEDHDA